MSLNMYLGEVQSQTQSMNAICNATIQSMEQVIQSIDAFAIDTVLQGQTYSSAKSYLVQTFRPLAQGIICLCEELIRQNEAFPNEFQAKVASTDVIEQEIREQIRGINQSITSIEAIEVLTPMPGVGAIVTVLGAMRKKLEEKLEHLYEFNHSSSNNYSTALQLAASITAGLAEVQSGKGFSPVSGTFSTQGLNMDWVSSIQGIIEEQARKNDQSIKDIETNNIIEKKSPVRNAWDDATDSIVGTFETAKKMWEAIQRGSGKAIGDEIESAIALSNMDIGTFINVTYALFHLDETAKNMWHAFSNKIKRDMIEGDAESRTELTTYGLTQIATTILGDRALNKVGHITKGAKASSGVSTFANAVKLAKELKPTLEMLQSFKREASYAFSSVGGTIITKIPQGELIEAYYKFAKSKDGGKGTGGFSNGTSRANKVNIPESSIKHSNVGDFTTHPKTGDISKMKGGGHGQSNIEFLEKNNVDYNINKVYENGVRVGNVPGHKVKAKRTGSNQSWFPESWTESDITAAGAKIAELPGFANTENGVAIFGEYNGVRVGVIKTNGEIGTIFPDATKQP
ncbi:membrane protein [Streptococcus pneumoniae]|nr:membrane protein [Streptococcus pneumoniae]CJC51580.1 membrane protein [Streptococcus pneumoniae]CJN45733.1 membrane protein [Streptococcus pneumoniae]